MTTGQRARDVAHCNERGIHQVTYLRVHIYCYLTIACYQLLLSFGICVRSAIHNYNLPYVNLSITRKLFTKISYAKRPKPCDMKSLRYRFNCWTSCSISLWPRLTEVVTSEERLSRLSFWKNSFLLMN